MASSSDESTSSAPTPPTTTKKSPRRHLAVFSIHSTIFLSLLSLRILNAVTTRTFFQPDEYFQSLEPAWNLAFGDSAGGWITWEWRHRLRSIAHPMLFAGVYKAVAFICKTLHISPNKQAEALAASPRVLQALFAAMGDWATARLAGVLWGSDTGWIALCLSLGSVWQWFCATRTLANSLETVVTALALSVWPWTWATGDRAGPRQVRSEVRLSLLLAAVACVLRPTNVLVWAFLGSFAMWHAGPKRGILVMEAAWIGIAVLGVNARLDYEYYGEWTFPPLTFLRFNVLKNLSVFYGRNDWHYYLSQGLPLLLTSFLPLALYALVTSLRRGHGAGFQLSATVVGVIAVYSCLAHKEVRFVFPLLPMLHVLSAKTLHELEWRSKAKNRLLVVMIVANLPVAYYATMVHQRGVVDVIEYLAETRGDWDSAGFLMPCHSTPWKAFVGGKMDGKKMWALTCEPPVDSVVGYVDEADEFYDDPRAFMNRYLGKGKRYELPQRLVVFQALLDEDGGERLWGGLYEECWRGFNSQVHDDARRRGDVVVMCRTAEREEMNEEEMNEEENEEIMGKMLEGDLCGGGLFD